VSVRLGALLGLVVQDRAAPAGKAHGQISGGAGVWHFIAPAPHRAGPQVLHPSGRELDRWTPVRCDRFDPGVDGRRKTPTAAGGVRVDVLSDVRCGRSVSAS